MNIRRSLIALGWIAFGYSHSALSGQTAVPIEVTSLPVWHSDGSAASLSKQFVFRDSRTEEIVVSYPDRRDPARRVTFRFWLNNRVDPETTLVIKVNTEKIFSYEYALSNGPTAKTPIQMWNVVGPPGDSQLSISHPIWGGTNGSSTPVAVQALLENEARGAFMMWASRGSPVRPGSELTGFKIVSRYRPGFTTAYAIGDGGITSPGEVPEEVVQQLIPLQRPAVTWKPFLTIGPRFGPEVTLSQIMRKYREEILWLSKRGTVDATSAYVRGLLSAITKCEASGRIEGFPLSQSPKSPIEISLAMAFESLQTLSRR